MPDKVNIRMKRYSVPSLILFIVCVSHSARASSEETDRLTPGWVLKTDIFALLNPDGVIIRGALEYQLPLKEKFDMVWSRVSLGYHVNVSPVQTAAGIHAEWMPAAFFQLQANYSLLFFHNVMGSLAEFDNADVAINDDQVQDLGIERPGMGHRLSLSPILMAYYTGILLLNQFDLKCFMIDAHKPYYFNWELQTLSKSTDIAISNRTMLMYNFFKHRKVQTFFAGAMYAVEAQPSTDFRRQFVAAATMVEPLKKQGRMGTLCFLLLSGIYLEDFYRKNELFVLLNVGSEFDFRK